MELSRDDNANLGMDPNADDNMVKVHYVCGGKFDHVNESIFVLDCGKDNTLDKDTVIRCIYCGHRIFYKKRERKLLQYEAR